jgi:signal transduction histidine kinase
MEELVRDKEAMARAGELTAGIVHEVRNGLGPIVGYARLLEKGALSAEAEAARGILQECETLETVARRFMDFVRDETLNLAPVDVERLLTRVAARESRSRPGGKVHLEDLARLPSLVGDEEMLERAFENVIRNAREAAGPEGHVAVAARVEDRRLCVSVTDDGPGLPSEARVPRPFYTTKPGGLGLGLPMAVKIVRLHNGELRLLEGVSRGLEVRVSLPLEGPPR